MKTLYLECRMGAAGDMLAAALYELLPAGNDFSARFAAAGIPGVTASFDRTEKCGVTGTHFSVSVRGEAEGAEHGRENEHSHGHEHEHEHEHTHRHEHKHTHALNGKQEHHHTHSHGHHHDHGEHHDHGHEHHHSHSGMADISLLIDGLNVSDRVKKDVKAVYGIIADAESKVHGKAVSEIHFHEVGALDAVADVTAACMLMETLGAGKVLASPVNTGSGTVNCAHGVLPVPAPATELILRGVPVYADGIRSELCTPTGAALLKYFVSEFREMPAMTVEKTGYGMGTKDFERANCLRAFLGIETGRTESISARGDAPADGTETVVEFRCQTDDMTGEQLAYACEKLFAGGALDVFTQSVYMKKGRPGVLLTVLCREEKKDEILELIFRHTSTIGVREYRPARYVMTRREEIRQTPFGEVRVKRSEGFGAAREKPEFDDLARIADENGISLAEAANRIGYGEE
ncbi:MAG: nickel pincer cofactor biosynthesis protein LarC [Clostridia bacterium]|nr:nickel pincer cofactor biosynthesis protein LarC [Clostridia bacterium]